MKLIPSLVVLLCVTTALPASKPPATQPGATITPDANGNILNDGIAAYTWNGRNQLISRGSTSFEYDSLGRRILNAAGNDLLL